MNEKGKEEDADMNTSQSDEWTTEQQQTANTIDKDHDDEEAEGERHHSAGPIPSVHRSRHDHIVYLPNLHLDFN